MAAFLMIVLLSTQLIPARGRKPDGEQMYRVRKTTQLIPARGRKHDSGRDWSKGFRHNLSPRGDGNFPIPSARSSSFPTQLIPARGRKPGGQCKLALPDATQLIPARGRKRGWNAMRLWPLLTQLIPARGRVGDCGHRPLLRCNHKT